MNPSILTYTAHMQGRVMCTISQDKKKFITLGCDDLIMVWNTSDMTSRKQIQLSNQNQQMFTCIEYNQQDHLFAIGTQSGKVYLLQQTNTSNKQLIYQNTTQLPIQNLKYSTSYRYLAISSFQQRGVIYDRKNSNFFKCDADHQGQVTYMDFSRNQKIVMTSATDGYINIYLLQAQSINQLQFIAKYQICYTKQLYNLVNFSQRPQNQLHFSFAGFSTLQQLVLTPNPTTGTLQPKYQVKVQIHEQSQFTQVCWLNQHIISIGITDKFTLWNYTTKQKIQVIDINNSIFWPILTDGMRIFGIDYKSGLIYKWENSNFVNFQNQQATKYIYNINNPVIYTNNQPDMKPQQNLNNQQNNLQTRINKKPKPKPQISIADKLVTSLAQTGLQSKYQQHLDSCFMFYNQHGCIIKRNDGNQQIMELQFHDKFKIRRIRFQSKYKFYSFVITQNCFMYASFTHVYFVMQGHRKVKNNEGILSKQPYFFKWDYKLPSIQAIAIGNTWVAIAGQDEIRIFDYQGNQLHIISFDRMILSIAAYQDLLAIAYTASIPMGNSNLFQLKFYKIDTQICKLQKTVKMPIKIEQSIKWFGFSQQGCLFNHDSSQTIRMFCWQTDQWINVYQTDAKKYKIYIQHIQNYQIYGFKIQQKQGEPTAPTVLPRSLPCKIFFQFPHRKLPYLTQQQNKKFQQIYISKLSLIHEKYRTNRWYKYKYSRNQDHYMYKYSQKIKTQEQITQSIIQLDLFIIQSIKKLLNLLENVKKMRQEQIRKIKQQLLGLCTQLLEYKSSLDKVREILGLGNPLVNYMEMQEYEEYRNRSMMKMGRKYNKMSRLSAMIDMGWIDRTQN